MINKDKLYTYFDKLHGPLKRGSNGWYDGVCPFCGQPKLAVHFGYLKAKCWRGCFKGFAMNLIMQHHDINYFESKELVDEFEPTYSDINYIKVSRGLKGSDITLPPGYNSILSGNSSLGDRARTYLKGRGFDLNYLDRLGVGYCNEEHKQANLNFFGYIIIPFKKDGELVYYIGRDYTGNFPRYKNPPAEEVGVGKSEVLFNEGALYMHDRIYLVEGWADASTIGPQGLSIQGSDLSIYQKTKIIESPVEEVIIIPDLGFYAAGLYTATHLYKHKVVRVVDLWPLREFGKDVNEIGDERVMELSYNSPVVTKKFLYKTLRQSHAKRPVHTY